MRHSPKSTKSEKTGPEPAPPHTKLSSVGVHCVVVSVYLIIDCCALRGEYWLDLGIAILMDHYLPQNFANSLPHVLIGLIKIRWPIARQKRERQNFQTEKESLGDEIRSEGFASRTRR